jgi:hypothetical protein
MPAVEVWQCPLLSGRGKEERTGEGSNFDNIYKNIT